MREFSTSSISFVLTDQDVSLIQKTSQLLIHIL